MQGPSVSLTKVIIGSGFPMPLFVNSFARTEQSAPPGTLNLNVSFPLLNSQHLHGGTDGGGASPCKQQSIFSQRDPFPWKTPPISLHSNGVISGLQTLPTQHAPL